MHTVQSTRICYVGHRIDTAVILSEFTEGVSADKQLTSGAYILHCVDCDTHNKGGMGKNILNPDRFV